MRSSVSLALLSAAGLASARTFDINVGQGGQVFTPDTVTGAVAGDVINFHFFPANHSVVQGAFGTGCQPAQGGFFSGFMPVPAGQQGANMFSVNITSSTTFPLFFYCGVPGHCRNAMVGVINPSTAQTLSAYQAQSRAATSVVVPPAVAGGQVLPNVVGSSPSPSVSSRPSTATAPGSSNTAVAPPPGSYSYSYSPGPAPTDASQPPSTGSGAGSSAGSGAGMQKSAPAGLAAGAFAALAFAWLMG